MIAKEVKPKAGSGSHFNRLVEYLTDDQGKSHRVEQGRCTNCLSATVDAAVSEVLATQQQNTRAKGDKTYHLLVSFPEGEDIDDATLAKIEASLCEALGFSEHQRISAVHRDTDNLHFHVAINKIHPEKLTMHEPYYSYKKLAEVCDRLEDEYGLQKDNHTPGQRLGQSRAQDMEAHSGQESLITWTRKHCQSSLQDAKSWQGVHQVLGEHGLRLHLRGNGLVISADNGVSIKASSVHRTLSKPALEKRLGVFVPATEGTASSKTTYDKPPIPLAVDTQALYQRYQQQRQLAKLHISHGLEHITQDKQRRLNALELAGKLKRFAISQESNGLTRKLLYKQHFKSMQKQRQALQARTVTARQQIYQQHRQLTWADWLKQEAGKGDEAALSALRARQPKRHQQSNQLRAVTGQPVAPELERVDSITKKGTIIDRKTGIKETANGLIFPLTVTAGMLRKGLLRANERFGEVVAIEGTRGFKQLAAKVAVSLQMAMRFTGDAEQYRQQLEERQNERHDGRRAAGRGHGVFGRTVGGVHGIGRGGERASEPQRQPDVRGVGGEPPATRRNRLQHLSQLGVASFKGESAVLLPRDVPDHLEQQRSGSTVDPLRWGVFGTRLNANQIKAAEKYIAERLDKRALGMDIAVHEPLTQAVKGLFAGVRRVDGESLLLISLAPDEVGVLPIKSDVRRLKIGDPITVNEQAKISKSIGLGW